MLEESKMNMEAHGLLKVQRADIYNTVISTTLDMYDYAALMGRGGSGLPGAGNHRAQASLGNIGEVLGSGRSANIS